MEWIKIPPNTRGEKIVHKRLNCAITGPDSNGKVNVECVDQRRQKKISFELEAKNIREVDTVKRPQ